MFRKSENPLSQLSEPGNKSAGIQAWIWPLIVIAIGGYRIHHATYSTAGQAWNIFLIVFGLIGLGLAAFTAIVGTPATATKRVAKQQKELWGGLHEYRDATDDDLRPLDRAFYETATAQLTANGFRHIRDLVNVTTSNTWPRNHTVLRCFVGNSNSTMAAVYHLRMYGGVRVLQLLGLISRKLKIVEFESELSDGTFVTTANNAESERTLGYPFVDRLQFPSNTPGDQLIKSHREHLNTVLASKPGVHVVAIHSYRDLRASQDRLHLLKIAHRRSPNFDHRAEWAKIAGRPLRPEEVEMADQVAADVRAE